MRVAQSSEPGQPGTEPRRPSIAAAALFGFSLSVSFAALGQAACGTPTPRDMEGPFYKAGAPLRGSLIEPGAKAERMVLTGRVLSRDCKPLANASLDFWHADERGEYDGGGYRYRGRVATDGEGRYRLETNLPALYPGRPRHIHVKVQAAPGARTLTTQLYFRDEQSGPLSLATERREGALHAAFDFVLQ